ncbi:MAG: sterol desaturase family protein [Bacteroidota bacterium]
METHISYLLPVIGNLARYFIFAGIPFLIFYALYPDTFSNNKIQSRLAKHKDFIREILHSLQTIGILAIVGIVLVFSPLRAYTQMYGEIQDYPIWWIPISIVLALVIHDSYFYWMHRTIHHQSLFKWFHVVHHKSVNPSPFASYSFNFLEGILEAMVGPIIFFLVPMHPISIFLFTLLAFIINVYGHLGYEIAPKWFRRSFLFEIVNTSVHHNLHHKKFRGNYGLYFRVWDRLMGTEHPDYVKEYDLIQARRFGQKETSSSKQWILPMVLFLSLTGSSIYAQQSIEGTWFDEVNGGIISIYEQDGNYYGQLLEATNPKEQALIEGKSIHVLYDFKRTEENAYCCGMIFQPRRDIRVSGNLVLVNEQTLRVEGRYGPFTQRRTWKRIKEEQSPAKGD